MTYSEINPPPAESLADYGPQPDEPSSDFAGAGKIESSPPNGQPREGLVEVPGVGFFDPAVAREMRYRADRGEEQDEGWELWQPALAKHYDPPPQRWAVDGFFPHKDVSLFTGDGDLGKSTMLEQLQAPRPRTRFDGGGRETI